MSGQAPQPAASAGDSSQNRPLARPSDINNGILSNLHNLLSMDQGGKLNTTQQNQLRQLINTQIRAIVLHALLNHRPNPLHSLPPHLDPTKDWEHGPAIISHNLFEEGVKAAEAAAQVHMQRNAALSGPNPLFSLPELSHYLKIEGQERSIVLESDPRLKAKFSASCAYWTKMSQHQQVANAANGAAGSSVARPPSARPGPVQVQGINRPAPTAAFLGAATTTSNGGIPSVLVDSAPKMEQVRRPEIVEDESTRRRRKLKEFVSELAPGLEMEMGVTEVLSEVIDSFVEEAARGSVRIAKHRRADKVELKDAAFFLDRTYDITVPGFNVQPSRRSHLAPEGERRKGRAVAPRAARLARANAAKDVEIER